MNKKRKLALIVSVCSVVAAVVLSLTGNATTLKFDSFFQNHQALDISLTERYEVEKVGSTGWVGWQNMLSASNVNSPTNNYTIAFGGSEWLVVGGKDGEGKDVITGNAETTNGTGKSIAVASLPNNALTILKKSIDGDHAKYQTTNNYYTPINNSLNYAGSYVQTKLNSLVSELSATERALIHKRTLQGGSGTLETYPDAIDSERYWTQESILEAAATTTTGYFFPRTPASGVTTRRLIGEGRSTPHPNLIDLYAFATLRQSHGYTGTYKPDNVADTNGVANQEYWELSVAEAALMPEEILNFGFTVGKGNNVYAGQGYWLRTPGSNQWYTDKMMSFVMYYDLTDSEYDDDTYYIDYMGSPVSSVFGRSLLTEAHVRPAAFLNVNNTLFTTAVSAKPNEYSDSGVVNDTATAQKITLNDPSLQISNAGTTLYQVGNAPYSYTYEVEYTGATPGKNLAAVLIRDGQVAHVYYLDADNSASGNNVVPSSGAGTATIILPEDDWDGEQILSVYVETRNVGNYIDFASAPVSFKIPAKLKFVEDTLEPIAIGTPFTLDVSAIGISGITYTFIGDLPEGVSYNPAEMTVSGTTPNDAGLWTFTVIAHDPRGAYDIENTWTLDVYEIAFITDTVPVGLLDVAYSVDVSAECVAIMPADAPMIFSVVSGELPAGLNLNSTTGNISGIPTTFGTFVFTLKVQKDYGGKIATRQKEFMILIFKEMAHYGTFAEVDGGKSKSFRILQK